MITITNEDNMELMVRYPDKYFNLALVDPPYGVGGDSIHAGRISKGAGKLKKQSITKNVYKLGYSPHKRIF